MPQTIRPGAVEEEKQNSPCTLEEQKDGDSVNSLDAHEGNPESRGGWCEGRSGLDTALEEGPPLSHDYTRNSDGGSVPGEEKQDLRDKTRTILPKGTIPRKAPGDGLLHAHTHTGCHRSNWELPPSTLGIQAKELRRIQTNLRGKRKKISTNYKKLYKVSVKVTEPL